MRAAVKMSAARSLLSAVSLTLLATCDPEVPVSISALSKKHIALLSRTRRQSIENEQVGSIIESGIVV